MKSCSPVSDVAVGGEAISSVQKHEPFSHSCHLSLPICTDHFFFYANCEIVTYFVGQRTIGVSIIAGVKISSSSPPTFPFRDHQAMVKKATLSPKPRSKAASSATKALSEFWQPPC